MKINILGGNGEMGKVHRPIFEAAGHEVIISGRHSTPSLEEAVQQSDLTIISVPLEVTREVIQKVAPYCNGKAIMDFTSVKVMPVNTMLGSTPSSCEVGGLHPLYGEVNSISGRTVIYCPTERSGARCEEIVQSFVLAGAKIKTMTPRVHDYTTQAKLQNARLLALKGLARIFVQARLNVNEIYNLSPPPTKIVLDLIARQYDPKNDALYAAMLSENSRTPEIKALLVDGINYSISPEKVREFFGEELKPAQERSRGLEGMAQEESYVASTAKLQNARLLALKSLARIFVQTGLNIKELYDLSPPPTKIVLDLIARQYDPKNDALYAAMLSENSRTPEIKALLIDGIRYSISPEKVREFFGEELKPAQERVARIITAQ